MKNQRVFFLIFLMSLSLHSCFIQGALLREPSTDQLRRVLGRWRLASGLPGYRGLIKDCFQGETSPETEEEFHSVPILSQSGNILGSISLRRGETLHPLTLTQRIRDIIVLESHEDYSNFEELALLVYLDPAEEPLCEKDSLKPEELDALGRERPFYIQWKKFTCEISRYCLGDLKYNLCTGRQMINLRRTDLHTHDDGGLFFGFIFYQ